MSKAIGMVEYKTVASGVVAADAMVKTSEVDIIEAQTVCPGKYIVIISGDLSAVRAAVDNAKNLHGRYLINSFVLGNPHESIFPAIYGATAIEDVSALGIVETYDATSIIVAADEAAKTAIDLVIRKKIPKSTHGYYLTSLIRLSEDDCYINKIKELMESRAQKGKKDKYYNSRNKL